MSKDEGPESKGGMSSPDGKRRGQSATDVAAGSLFTLSLVSQSPGGTKGAGKRSTRRASALGPKR